jgi:hypothetical protein
MLSAIVIYPCDLIFVKKMLSKEAN